jgi:hypothetical protein
MAEQGHLRKTAPLILAQAKQGCVQETPQDQEVPGIATEVNW